MTKWTNIKQFWLHFFEVYKQHKCLWDVNAVEYMNTAKRKAAYEELIRLSKEINFDADKRFVRSRINNARTAFRKEVKKVTLAKESGTVYKPKLFYFNLLYSFLSSLTAEENAVDLDSKNSYCNFSEDEETRSIENEQISSSQLNQIDLSNCEDREELARCEKAAEIGRTRPLKRTKRDEEINDYVNNDTVDDECDILGKRLATHFRNMRQDQRLLAEKIISDVCIYARLDQLTFRSGLAIHLPSNINNFALPSPNQLPFCLDSNDDEVVLAPDEYMRLVE